MKPTFALFATLCFALPASAQTLYGSHNGEKANDRFGWSVAGLGDLNLDGRPDYGVGVPEDGSAFSPGEGYVRVYSGLTGSPLFTLQGSLSAELFGADVETLGDINGDNRPDILVGAPGSGPAVEGRVLVYSALGGSPLLNLLGANGNDQIGHAVSALADINFDGKPEILAGGPAASSGGSQRGVVHVYSGANGNLLLSVLGTNNNQRLGQGVANLGDINGDGRGDFLVGSLTGGATVYSGNGASVIYSYPANGNDRFGSAVCSLNDLNGDGKREFAISGTQDGSVFAPGPGYVKVYSGATGTLLFTVNGIAAGDRYGSALNGAGDVNGDGKEDLAVAADQFSFGGVGYVQVLSGANGAVLFQMNGTASSERYGQGLDVLGDLNLDGQPELAIGVPGRSAGFTLAGQVEIWSLPQSCPTPVSYCTPMPNSTGGPALMGSSGSTSVSANNFQLTVTGAPANKLGLFVYSAAQAATPAGNGILCIGSPFVRLAPIVTLPNGSASFNLPFASLPPSGPIAAGDTRYFVFWHRDPDAGGANFNFSNGLQVLFCP